MRAHVRVQEPDIRLVFFNEINRREIIIYFLSHVFYFSACAVYLDTLKSIILITIKFLHIFHFIIGQLVSVTFACTSLKREAIRRNMKYNPLCINKQRLQVPF